MNPCIFDTKTKGFAAKTRLLQGLKNHLVSNGINYHLMLNLPNISTVMLN